MKHNFTFWAWSDYNVITKNDRLNVAVKQALHFYLNNCNKQRRRLSAAALILTFLITESYVEDANDPNWQQIIDTVGVDDEHIDNEYVWYRLSFGFGRFCPSVS